MQGKLHTLIEGVRKSINQLNSQDRFRVITFNNRANEITNGWLNATEENKNITLQALDQVSANGGTNIYDGLSTALKKLDNDRATSIILVTDGVTNQGIIEPKAFYKLMSNYDVRVFGFLLGNSSNWPLMQVITEQSGGFYRAVSNSDDIIGEIILTKNKILYECLHDAEVKISGVKTFDLNGYQGGKIYRGQQLVLFGKYNKSGEASITLDATLTGEDKTYNTTFNFPETSNEHPEIERLWAMSQIEKIEFEKMIGKQSPSESKDAIADIGVAYQIVTDETSMIVLSDEKFQNYGIERKNKMRLAEERKAQQARKQTAAQNNRIDQQQPMFSHPAPRPTQGGGNGGGGALSPWFCIILSMTFLVSYCPKIKKEVVSTKIQNAGSFEFPAFTSSNELTKFSFVTIGLSVMTLLIYFIPELTSNLELTRTAFSTNESWRIITGHFTHWNFSHLAWDLLAFVILGIYLEKYNRRLFVRCTLFTAIITSSLIFLHRFTIGCLSRTFGH